MNSVDVVISTVGNSLFNNLLKAQQSEAATIPLKQLDLNNPIQLTKYVRSLPDEDAICGAEIQSLSQMGIENILDAPALALELLCQDSDKAFAICTAIKGHESERFGECNIHRIPQLQGKDYSSFGKRGLRNLMLTMADLISSHQEKDHRVAISATGGFKAEVAYATLLGQMFGVPVLYRSKEFKRMVILPPMPIAPDINLWMEHADLFWRFDEEALLPAAELPENLDVRLQPLFEIEQDKHNERVAYLSPVGILYHRYCYRWLERKAGSRIPQSRSDGVDADVSIDEDHHWPAGTKEYLYRLAAKSSFITRIQAHRAGNGPIRWTTRFRPCLCDGLRAEGTFGDSSFHCYYYIWTTAVSRDEAISAVIELNRRFPR